MKKKINTTTVVSLGGMGWRITGKLKIKIQGYKVTPP